MGGQRHGRFLQCEKVLQSLSEWIALVCRLCCRKPAAVWTQALPVGNGRLFRRRSEATPPTERGHRLVGREAGPAQPRAPKAVPQVRRLLREGHPAEAQTIATILENDWRAVVYQDPRIMAGTRVRPIPTASYNMGTRGRPTCPLAGRSLLRDWQRQSRAGCCESSRSGWRSRRCCCRPIARASSAGVQRR
jgi:hypothetical protein